MPLDSNYAVSWDCPRSGGSFKEQLDGLDSKQKDLKVISAGKRIVYKNPSGEKSIIHFVTAEQFALLAHESSSSYVMTAKHCSREVQTKLNGAVDDFEKEIQKNQPAESDSLKVLQEKLKNLEDLSKKVKWTQSAASESDKILKDQFKQEGIHRKYWFFQRFFKRPKKLDKAKIEQLGEQQKTLQQAKKDAKSKIQAKQKEILTELRSLSSPEAADQLIEKAADYPEVIAGAKLAKFQLLSQKNPSEQDGLKEITKLGLELSEMKCFEDAERPLLSGEEILSQLTQADNFDELDNDELNQQFETFFYVKNDGKEFNLKMAESLQKLDMSLEASKFYGKARAISPSEDNASLNQAVLAEHRKTFGHDDDLEDLNISLSTAIWEIGVAEDFAKAEEAFKEALGNPPDKLASGENASEGTVENSPKPEISKVSGEKLRAHFQTIASHRKSSEFEKATYLRKKFPGISERLNFDELKKSHPDLLIDMDGQALDFTLKEMRALIDNEKPFPKRYDEMRKIVMNKEFLEAYIEQAMQAYPNASEDKVREQAENELEAVAVNFKQLAARSSDLLELLEEALQPLNTQSLLGENHNHLQECADNLAKVFQSEKMQRYREAVIRSGSLIASIDPILNRSDGAVEQWWKKLTSQEIGEGNKTRGNVIFEETGIAAQGIGAQITSIVPFRLLRIRSTLEQIQNYANNSICLAAEPSLGVQSLTTAAQIVTVLANELNIERKAAENIMLGAELRQVATKKPIDEVAVHAAVIAPVQQEQGNSEEATLEVGKVTGAIISAEGKLQSALENSNPPKLETIEAIEVKVEEWKEELKAISNQGVELRAVRDVEHAIQRVEDWIGFYRLLESCSAEGADANQIRKRFYGKSGVLETLKTHNVQSEELLKLKEKQLKDLQAINLEELKDDKEKEDLQLKIGALTEQVEILQKKIAILPQQLTTRFEKAYAPLAENESRISELKESVTKALQAVGSADRYDLKKLRASMQRWKSEVSALKVDTLEKELEMLTRWEAFCTKLEACTRSEANPLSIFEAAPSKIEADPSKINEKFYGENGLRDQLASFQPDSKRGEYSKNVTHHFEVMFSNFDSSYEKVDAQSYDDLIKRKAQLETYLSNSNAPKKKVEKTLAWLNFHIGMHEKTTYKDLKAFDAAFPETVENWISPMLSGIAKEKEKGPLLAAIRGKYDEVREGIIKKQERNEILHPDFLKSIMAVPLNTPANLEKKLKLANEMIDECNKSGQAPPAILTKTKDCLQLHTNAGQLKGLKGNEKKNLKKKTRALINTLYADNDPNKKNLLKSLGISS